MIKYKHARILKSTVATHFLLKVRIIYLYINLKYCISFSFYNFILDLLFPSTIERQRFYYCSA